MNNEKILDENQYLKIKKNTDIDFLKNSYLQTGIQIKKQKQLKKIILDRLIELAELAEIKGGSNVIKIIKVDEMESVVELGGMISISNQDVEKFKNELEKLLDKYRI